MKKRTMVGGLILAAQILGIAGAAAGPWEDGMASYNRGDYMPAIRLFRPLAEQGNVKAQHLIGVMYHKGEGVARNSVRAFAWFSLAAAPRRAGEIARSLANHDAGGAFAGAGHGASLRDVELSELRVLNSRIPDVQLHIGE
jgi:TPR repeat protein